MERASEGMSDCTPRYRYQVSSQSTGARFQLGQRVAGSLPTRRTSFDISSPCAFLSLRSLLQPADPFFCSSFASRKVLNYLATCIKETQ